MTSVNVFSSMLFSLKSRRLFGCPPVVYEPKLNCAILLNFTPSCLGLANLSKLTSAFTVFVATVILFTSK